MGKAQTKVFNDPRNSVPPIQGMSPNQTTLITAIKDYEQVITLGPAGTGKTFIAAGMAADWYSANNKRKLVITRPMIPVGEDFGFLPGTLEEKTQPWALPVLDVIARRVGKGKLECDLGKSIEIVPLQLMRGRTFDDCWIIADEAQNLSVEQAKMLVTRIGVNSKLLINGDIAQKDIPGMSGLSWLVNNVYKHDLPVPVVEFNIGDCQRSGLCRMWLEVLAKGD